MAGPGYEDSTMKLSSLLLFSTGVAAGYYLLAPIARAFAESAPEASFEGMDADGDGRIGADEHAVAARRMFARMDANADGKVSAAEMDAAQPRVTGRRARRGAPTSAQKIGVVDRNRDGVLSRAEHGAGAARMFARMDANGDGALDRKEFARGHAVLKSARAGKAGR